MKANQLATSSGKLLIREGTVIRVLHENLKAIFDQRLGSLWGDGRPDSVQLEERLDKARILVNLRSPGLNSARNQSFAIEKEFRCSNKSETLNKRERGAQLVSRLEVAHSAGSRNKTQRRKK